MTLPLVVCAILSLLLALFIKSKKLRALVSLIFTNNQTIEDILNIVFFSNLFIGLSFLFLAMSALLFKFTILAQVIIFLAIVLISAIVTVGLLGVKIRKYLRTEKIHEDKVG